MALARRRARAIRGRASSTRRPAARRRTPPPLLSDYGLVGDLRTAALCSRFGSIDWCCLPEFDSPSTFARLLDLERGGCFEVLPEEPFRSEQGYLPSTAILRTTFSLPRSRTLAIQDFMPILPGAPGPMLVRVVEASGGSVRARVVIDPRPGYARFRPKWSSSGEAWVGSSPAGTLGLRPGWPLRAGPGGLSGIATIQDGGRAVFEMYWGSERPTATPAIDLLNATEQFWRGWVHPPDSPIHMLAGRWHPWIERSEITLKLLTRSDSGAFVAAPTTSIPEWPGGARNWDYRYVWIRDAAFAAQCFALMGHMSECRAFLHWLVDVLHRAADSGGLRVMYGTHPGAELDERTLPQFSGYLDSRPVRVGNAASRQFQLDIYGELLDAARLLAEIERDSLTRTWPLLERLADEVVRQWRRPDRGIWELRSRPAHYVYSKVMAWVALDRAAALGHQYGARERTARWELECDRIRAAVLERGFDRRHGTFVRSFEHRALDASNLRIPLVGFLAPDDPRIAGTVLAIERNLSVGPFVRRFLPSAQTGGPEGAFLPCSYWLVECLARAGERERAKANFDALFVAAGPLGLLPEEYDPARRLPLGNYPQAFTHIAMLRAALSLGLSVVPASILEQHPALAQGVRRRPLVDRIRADFPQRNLPEPTMPPRAPREGHGASGHPTT